MEAKSLADNSMKSVIVEIPASPKAEEYNSSFNRCSSTCWRAVVLFLAHVPILKEEDSNSIDIQGDVGCNQNRFLQASNSLQPTIWSSNALSVKVYTFLTANKPISSSPTQERVRDHQAQYIHLVCSISVELIVDVKSNKTEPKPRELSRVNLLMPR
jgi:hypothetical protein